MWTKRKWRRHDGEERARVSREEIKRRGACAGWLARRATASSRTGRDRAGEDDNTRGDLFLAKGYGGKVGWA
jgi:hypothetical protein